MLSMLSSIFKRVHKLLLGTITDTVISSIQEMLKLVASVKVNLLKAARFGLISFPVFHHTGWVE